MTAYLKARQIRIFDYPRFAQPLRDALRENAERLAAEHGLEIMFIRKKNFRKEDRVKEILAKRGHHPGLVCIFSAMEPCATYQPWHDKKTGKTYLRPRRRQVPALLLLFHRPRAGPGLCSRSHLVSLPSPGLS